MEFRINCKAETSLGTLAGSCNGTNWTVFFGQVLKGGVLRRMRGPNSQRHWLARSPIGGG